MAASYWREKRSICISGHTIFRMWGHSYWDDLILGVQAERLAAEEEKRKAEAKLEVGITRLW